MTPEVVSVPTKGIERWLSQRLSARLGVTPGGQDGVCANITFPFPGTLVSGALARATGNDPKADPWMPERSVWPLMEVVEQHFDEPWLAPLAVHIRNAGAARTRRAGNARAARALLHRAARRRPLRSLRRAPARHGAALGPGRTAPRRGGLAGRALAPPARPHRPAEPGGAPEARLRRAAGRARPARPPGPALVVRPDTPAGELPRRPRRHGRHTRCPPLPAPPVAGALEAPRAARRTRDETPAPSGGPDGSGRAQPAARIVGPRRPRDATRSRRCARHTATRRTEAEHAGERTLLQRIQDDVRADRAPASTGGRSGRDGDARPLLAADDDSIRVHSCHGRSRQVEVLRDAILHLLEENPELEARDIIVMCPDIEHFAPLIQATFGAHDEEGGRVDGTRQLRIRLGRPLPPPDQPGDGRPGGDARPRHRADDGEPGPRSRRARACAAAIPLYR